MSSSQRINRSASRSKSSSSSMVERAQKSSMIYNILPSAVQTRIPQIPSLRRSFSACHVHVRQQSSALVKRSWAGGSDVGFVEEDSVSSTDSTPPSSPPTTPTRGTRGREWMYANHGINLLETVLTEGDDPGPGSQAISRQLYVQASVTLVQGLPQDLSEQEATMITNALPPVLQQRLKSSPQVQTRGAQRYRSLPHRAIASTIVQFFLLLQLFLPYVRLIFKAAYEYEQTHHVVEKTITAGISAADRFGNASVEAFKAVLWNNNRGAAQGIAALVLWSIGEASGGIQEGVDRCVDIVDNEDEQGFASKKA